MRIFVPLLIVLAVLYFWDVEFNQGTPFGWLAQNGTIYLSQRERPPNWPDLPIGQFPTAGKRAPVSASIGSHG